MAGLAGVLLAPATGQLQAEDYATLVVAAFAAAAWATLRSMPIAALVGILMGSQSDMDTMQSAAKELSDRGIGFLTIDEYNHFRIPQMYASLILIFILAVGANVLIGRLETRARVTRAK